MLTRTQELILRFLLERAEEKNTIRGISRKLKKSYTLVYNNIKDLQKKDIVKKESVPPAQLITLNPRAPREIFLDIELKRKQEFLKKYPWTSLMLKDILKDSRNPLFILIVFGSYAKNLQDEKSDLDLLIIVQDKKDIAPMNQVVRKIYTKVEKSLNIVDIGDLKEMLNTPQKLNIGNEARKNHILLYGAEQYLELVKQAM